ncbi:hypothetical protein ILUMI_23773 [Ignelater luminosus]|uniref:Cytochrome P450 n=1 Tax=Ignelater luminosus TaxID=2038154 RepID=A0A8K0G1K1_IGNLU|nr:hypothetical protein ILUMI_23773 [Ignelater luminosus]
MSSDYRTLGHPILFQTLRKYPPTSFIHRECSEEYTLPETGLVIEQGTPIIVAQHGLHWHEKYFSNPEMFDPERFSDLNKHKIISGSYLPFGDGPRNCIGELFGLITSKMGIVEVIRNFQVVRNQQTREPIIFTTFPILQAKGGIPVTFRSL